METCASTLPQFITKFVSSNSPLTGILPPYRYVSGNPAVLAYSTRCCNPALKFSLLTFIALQHYSLVGYPNVALLLISITYLFF